MSNMSYCRFENTSRVQANERSLKAVDLLVSLTDNRVIDQQGV